MVCLFLPPRKFNINKRISWDLKVIFTSWFRKLILTETCLFLRTNPFCFRTNGRLVRVEAKIWETPEQRNGICENKRCDTDQLINGSLFSLYEVHLTFSRITKTPLKEPSGQRSNVMDGFGVLELLHILPRRLSSSLVHWFVEFSSVGGNALQNQGAAVIFHWAVAVI